MTVGHRQPGPSSPATTSERPSPSLGTLGPKAAILALHLSVTESRSVDGAISLHTAGRLAEAHRANELVGRTCALLLAGWRVGTEYVLENPADHQTMATSRVHDSSSTRCTDCPMWLLAEVIALKKLTSAEECTLFPMCMLGAQWQKEDHPALLCRLLSMAPAAGRPQVQPPDARKAGGRRASRCRRRSDGKAIGRGGCVPDSIQLVPHCHGLSSRLTHATGRPCRGSIRCHPPSGSPVAGPPPLLTVPMQVRLTVRPCAPRPCVCLSIR
jgi:hypothetical protein